MAFGVRAAVGLLQRSQATCAAVPATSITMAWWQACRASRARPAKCPRLLGQAESKLAFENPDAEALTKPQTFRCWSNLRSRIACKPAGKDLQSSNSSLKTSIIPSPKTQDFRLFVIRGACKKKKGAWSLLLGDCGDGLHLWHRKDFGACLASREPWARGLDLRVLEFGGSEIECAHAHELAPGNHGSVNPQPQTQKSTETLLAPGVLLHDLQAASRD